MSESVHLYEGRGLLRGLTARVRVALGLASADDMPERAIRLLDTVAAELRGADGLPELGVARESPVRLRFTRAGASGEVSIAWDSTVRMVVMHAEEETSSPTRLSRYTWDGTVGQWSTANLIGGSSRPSSKPWSPIYTRKARRRRIAAEPTRRVVARWVPGFARARGSPRSPWRGRCAPGHR